MHRRDFIEVLAAVGLPKMLKSPGAFASPGGLGHEPAFGSYRPGRISNEYSLFFPRGKGGSGNSTCHQEPEYSGQPLQFFNPRVSANHEYFSTSQFSLPALGSFGTARRRFFHGPGLNNWDFALQKVAHVTEGTSVEVRAEFFNVFNHAQFKNPVGDFASSAFGQVTAARDPRIGQLALKFSF